MTWCHKDGFYSIFLTFHGVYQINNAVIVSGGQARDSAMHTHMSILHQTPLPSSLTHNMEQDSLSCTVGKH